MGKVIALGRRQWAKRLNAQWDHIRKAAVEGFIAFGRDLLRAKDELGHGEFLQMVEMDTKFRSNTARQFMRIAKSQNVVNDHVLMPPDYNTLDKLTRLDDGTFARLVDNGTICPTLKRNEVSKILRLERVQADERRVLALAPVVGKFRTLVIDPAWEYDWLSIAGRARPGYAMQSIEHLRVLDLRQWAEPDCELYCWTTNNFMAEACKLVAGWGFQHRVLLTWVKPPPFGLGSYFRNSTEHVLYATLGEATTRPGAANIPTHFEAPRGEHSEKPEAFYDIVRRASYPPYGEANQRKQRSDFASLFVEEMEAVG